ncbi:MAG TPA: M20/M25/M40 family metallo-hydrolase, partial [Ignavibacteriales bacterium]|nr:M20/M25/M40 family metallo-hydrolase [Ignavibacteriales bacterium]
SILIDGAEEYIDDESCPVIIAKFYNSKEPDLLIIGHIDVVAGDDSQFKPFVKDGNLYGRGSKDMKAGIAAMIEIMNYYAAEKVKPNIAIAVVSDEESGGYKGASLIVNRMGYKPKLVITPDPGERHCIIHKEKGLLWFSVTAFGKSSHPSRPWLGRCAFQKAYDIWNKIAGEFNLSKGEDDWRSSAGLLDINKLIQNSDGTYAIDHSASIAGIARCRSDIRYTEEDDVEEIKRRLIGIVKESGEENIIEFHGFGPVCYTPLNNELLKRFKSAADFIEGKDIPVCASAGASDMRFFSEKKIPCLNYGPDGKNHHAPNEYVNINSIALFYNALIRFIDKEFLK